MSQGETEVSYTLTMNSKKQHYKYHPTHQKSWVYAHTPKLQNKTDSKAGMGLLTSVFSGRFSSFLLQVQKVAR